MISLPCCGMHGLQSISYRVLVPISDFLSLAFPLQRPIAFCCLISHQNHPPSSAYLVGRLFVVSPNFQKLPISQFQKLLNQMVRYSYSSHPTLVPIFCIGELPVISHNNGYLKFRGAEVSFSSFREFMVS